MNSFAKLACAAALALGCVTRGQAQSNTPPYFLTTPTNVTAPENTLIVVTNAAADAQGPTNHLSYGLVGAPSGATIDTNGVISWTPSESQGPSTNLIITVVADDGIPPLTALNTFTITVTESNSAPVLGFQADRTVVALTTLVVTNTVFDSDIPTNSFTWLLVNSPAGATIDASGVIRWTPGLSLINTTDSIQTVVTDNGVPPLSATNSFNVFVQTTNTTFLHTNALIPVNFSLTSYAQSSQVTINTNIIPTVRVAHIGTSDLLTTIGQNLGVGASVFTPNAKLYLKLPDLSAQAAIFVVRMGDVETNISGSLSLFAPDGTSVTSLKSQSSHGTNQVDYTVLEFDLSGTRGQFAVRGLATIRSSSVVDKGKTLDLEPVIAGFSATVSGSGRVGNAQALWTGTVTGGGRKIEVVETSQP